MFIYFLTIDKVKLGVIPTKQELLLVRDNICKVGDLVPIYPYQVSCFENKYKGKQHGYYLHYHCLLKSKKVYISYMLVAQTGYSVKLVKMKTSLDVAITAGYIQKLKIDYCDVEKVSKNFTNPEVLS